MFDSSTTLLEVARTAQSLLEEFAQHLEEAGLAPGTFKSGSLVQTHLLFLLWTIEGEFHGLPGSIPTSSTIDLNRDRDLTADEARVRDLIYSGAAAVTQAVHSSMVEPFRGVISDQQKLDLVPFSARISAADAVGRIRNALLGLRRMSAPPNTRGANRVQDDPQIVAELSKPKEHRPPHKEIARLAGVTLQEVNATADRLRKRRDTAAKRKKE